MNLAARVTAYARSGQILCTAPVAEAIRDLATARLHPVGEGHFKNVAQPVTLFAIEDPRHPSTQSEIDPVCRMRIDPQRAPARLPFGGRTYVFCSFACAQTFARSPETYHTAQV